MGIMDFDKKYELNEIIKGDTIFCATAITDTMSMSGVVKDGDDGYMTETLITHKSSKNKRMNIEKRRVVIDHP